MVFTAKAQCEDRETSVDTECVLWKCVIYMRRERGRESHLLPLPKDKGRIFLPQLDNASRWMGCPQGR